jgi:hypothetical protein
MSDQNTLIRPTEPETDSREMPQPRRRIRLSSVLATIIFSAVEIWAVIVVLVMLRVDGVLKVALCCAIAGALMSIYLAWQDLRREVVADERMPGRHHRET